MPTSARPVTPHTFRANRVVRPYNAFSRGDPYGRPPHQENGLPQPVTSVTGFAMTVFLQGVRCKADGGVKAKFFTVYINYSHIFALFMVYSE